MLKFEKHEGEQKKCMTLKEIKEKCITPYINHKYQPKNEKALSLEDQNNKCFDCETEFY